MTDYELDKILEKHATALLNKKINIRVMVLMDPTYRGQTGHALAKWLHPEKRLNIDADKLAEDMGTYIGKTDDFLKEVIRKEEEDRTSRTIYVSTKTRRIFLRIIRIPVKKIYQASQITTYVIDEKNPTLKHNSYYLGLSVAKEFERIEKDEKEKPQAIFDEIDLAVEDLRPMLGMGREILGHTLQDFEKNYLGRYPVQKVVPLLDKLVACYPEDKEAAGVVKWVKELVKKDQNDVAKLVFSAFADLRYKEDMAVLSVSYKSQAKSKRDELRKAHERWRQILAEEKKLSQL